jgi:WD40 repeat protein
MIHPRFLVILCIAGTALLSSVHVSNGQYLTPFGRGGSEWVKPSVSLKAQTYLKFGDKVTSVSVSRGGTYVLAATADGVAELRRTSDGSVVARFEDIDHQKPAFAFSSGGQRFLIAGKSGVRIFATADPERDPVRLAAPGVVSLLTVSPRDTVLGAGNGFLRGWSVQTGDPIVEHNLDGLPFAFSPEGSFVACVSGNNRIRTIDAQSGILLTELDGGSAKDDTIECLALSSEAEFVAIGQDEIVYSRLVRQKQDWRRLALMNTTFRCMAFSPVRPWVAYGMNNWVIRMVDAQSGNVVATFRAHHGPVTSIAFSADGAYLATGSDDRTVGVWNLKPVFSAG